MAAPLRDSRIARLHGGTAIHTARVFGLARNVPFVDSFDWDLFETAFLVV
jgi:hypothetical protein